MTEKETFDSLRYPLPKDRICNNCKYYRPSGITRVVKCDKVNHMNKCTGYWRKRRFRPETEIPNFYDSKNIIDYWEWEHD